MPTIYEVLQKFADVKEELPQVHWVEPRPRCDQCRDYEVMNYGDICEHCHKEWKQSYRVMYKMGRLANGAALDGGIRYHAVELGMPEYGTGKAFCGAKTGRRSAGWMRQVNQDVTCPRCIAKLAKIEQRAIVATETHMSRLKWLESTKG